MRDRLDVFIHALEQYCLMNQPADLLNAIQHAKYEVELADNENERLARQLDAECRD